MKNNKLTKEKLVERSYVYMTYKDIYSKKTDIAILSLPKKIVCADKNTYSLALKKLAACHIGTTSTKENLTITS